MELSAPHLLSGKVMHKRLLPRINHFVYRIYYLAIPLDNLGTINDGWRCGHNRPGLISLHDRDFGPRDGTPLLPWIRNILIRYNLTCADGQIILMTMPRVFGYAFNPVSFWLCHDRQGRLRAVLCEVNNTFGETHCYLCAHPDGALIKDDDILQAEKIFHVSPFLARDGSYQFRFSCEGNTCGIWIDYYTPEGDKKLVTALTGQLEVLTRSSLRKAFWQVPLVGLRALILIHWQALKLAAKGTRYIPKPPQLATRLSVTLKKFNRPETGK